MKIGYARCSTQKQDLRAQKKQLRDLGVDNDRIYVDHGISGRKRERPGLDQALAACRAGDTLVVTKLDRLARSISDAAAIADQLTDAGVTLQTGPTVYSPEDPVGKAFYYFAAIFAEFESDLIRQRTREGIEMARAEGKMQGKRSRFTPYQQKRMQEMLASGEYSQREIAELMGTSRSWVSRLAKRWRAQGLLDPPLSVLIPDHSDNDTKE